MRVTHLFLFRVLYCGMLIAPLGTALTSNVNGQDENRAQPQERGPGGPGFGGPGGPGGGRGGPGGRMMGGGGMGGSMGIASLIGMEEVRKELKLDEEQMKSLAAMRDSMRDSMGGGRGPGGPGGPGGPEGRGPRPEGGRPEGGRPEGGRPEGGRPEGGRPERGGFGGGPGGPPSAEQMKEMNDRMKKMRSEMEGKVSDILDPDQNSRILGLLIQRDGGRALTSSVLAAALELTPEQLTKLDEVQATNMQETMDAVRKAMGGGGGGGGQVREQMEAMGKKAGESMLEVLTSEQRTQFDSMKGEKFEFPERGPGFGGPGGPGGPGFGGPGGPGGGRGDRGDRPGGRAERPEIQ